MSSGSQRQHKKSNPALEEVGQWQRAAQLQRCGLEEPGGSLAGSVQLHKSVTIELLLVLENRVE